MPKRKAKGKKKLEKAEHVDKKRRLFLKGLAAGSIFLAYGLQRTFDYFITTYEESQDDPSLRQRYIDSIIKKPSKKPLYVGNVVYIADIDEFNDEMKKAKEKAGAGIIIGAPEVTPEVDMATAPRGMSGTDIKNFGEGKIISDVYIFPHAFSMPEGDFRSVLFDYEFARARIMHEGFEGLGLEEFVSMDGDRYYFNSKLFDIVFNLETYKSHMESDSWGHITRSCRRETKGYFISNYLALWRVDLDEDKRKDLQIRYWRNWLATETRIFRVEDGRAYFSVGDEKLYLPFKVIRD